MSSPQRLNVVYRINWTGGWHAGSGEESAGVDRRVRRRAADKQPYLPGSQLKGVLRHQCERLAALLDCPVLPPHQMAAQPPAELFANHRPLARSEMLIDRLFGTRYQGECLYVDDALPESAATFEIRPHSRTAMDRLTRTARDKTLFVSEVTSGGGALGGTIRARHPAGVLSPSPNDPGRPPLEYALLLTALLMLDALGGDRSAGLGHCTVEIPGDSVTWNGNSLPLDVALADMGEVDWKLLLDLAREGT